GEGEDELGEPVAEHLLTVIGPPPGRLKRIRMRSSRGSSPEAYPCCTEVRPGRGLAWAGPGPCATTKSEYSNASPGRAGQVTATPPQVRGEKRKVIPLRIVVPG